jgi:adhesin HecA-like repeat protein
VGTKHEQESSSERTVTNTSSTIQSGGNMSITAKGDATFVGATVESGGNLDVSAKSITNKAAQDTQEKLRPAVPTWPGSTSAPQRRPMWRQRPI